MKTDSDRPSESEEWLDELLTRWTEVYKKSMTTLVILRLVDEEAPIDVATLVPAFGESTGWTVTERGLYRTMKRLASSGLLHTDEVKVARTGAKRKDYSLTPAGRAYLERIEAELIP